ncbi:MAG TPA: nucleotidyltransferase domain-containing protein [Thermoanaerobaculia bacterium]|nr:nucleotidyltransferase domain-containing protein [Thermoanaerobaculia bacterium]
MEISSVALAARLSDLLEGRPEVVGAYLFGSRASGESREGSDVDLAVLFEGPGSLERVVELEDVLERALGRRVDVVDLGGAEAFLALDAVRGERVFTRDGLRLDELELYVLRRAGDLAPFERERRRQLLEKVGP